MTDQILFFYAIGIILFIIGIEEMRRPAPNNYLYLGMSFFINLMGYYISYSDSTFTSAAYFPLILLIFSAIMLIYMVFEQIRIMMDTNYERQERRNGEVDD